MSQPDYLISTPENVDLHLELAGLGNRIEACLIDSLLTWAIVLLLAIFCALVSGAVAMSALPEKIKVAVSYSIVAVALLCLLGILFGYYIFFEGLWHGQTPGKKIARIRVIEQAGQPVRWPGVIIRNLIRPVDMGLMLIGLISMMIDSRERRLGDLAAGTLVIRERRPSELNGDPKISVAPPEREMVDIGRITPQQYDILVSFLSRREMLSSRERPRLAVKLAQHFRKQLMEDSVDPPEVFLEKVYLSYLSRADRT